MGNQIDEVFKIYTMIPLDKDKLYCKFQVLRIIITKVIIYSRLQWALCITKFPWTSVYIYTPKAL